MKQLKFDHSFARLIKSGKKTATFRIADDKDISIGDTVQIVDKVRPDEPKSWRIIGEIQVIEVIVKPIGKLTNADYQGSETYEDPEDMLAAFRHYYGDQVSKL